MATTLIGLGLDVLTLPVPVGWLYRRRSAAPETTTVFVTLNIGLFAWVVVKQALNPTSVEINPAPASTIRKAGS